MPNANELTDREAAIDALIRFVCSLDEGDPDLAASSLTEDAIMDLTPFQALGWKTSTSQGRDHIVPTLMNSVGKTLDTTHSATNIRCTVKGDTANLTSTILAYHFRLGEGVKPNNQDYFLNGNKYNVDAVRDGDTWRISRVTIAPAWALGDPAVMGRKD